MDYTILTKVWDMSQKQTSSKSLTITNEYQLLIQVTKVLINYEGQCTEGRGKVIKTGSFVGRFKDQTVCFIKSDYNTIRNYEVILSQYCIVMENEDFLFEYTLKALMIYDFLLLNKYSHVVHLSDCLIFNKIISRICAKLRTKIIDLASESAYEILKVLKYDMVLQGYIFNDLTYVLDENENVVNYCPKVTQGVGEKRGVELYFTEWIMRLGNFKRLQYYNYIRNNEDMFKCSCKVINSLNLIHDNLKGPGVKVLVIKNLFTASQVTEKIRTRTEFKLPLPVITKHICYFPFCPSESSESLETFLTFNSSEETIDLNTLYSPRITFPYSHSTDTTIRDHNSTSKALKPHQASCSNSSTEHSLSFITPLDLSSESFSMITYLTDLITKYKNESVLNVLNSIHNIYTYQTCVKSIEGNYLKLLSDLSVYEGQMNENKQPHGYGTRYYPDGSVFRGFWKCAQASGNGLIITSDGFIYNGQWKNGMYHGYGSIRNKDRGYCEGTFKCGELEGIGIEVLTNGDKYHGNFVNSQKHGHGKIVFMNGVVFIGQFYEGKIEGMGKVYFRDRVFEGVFNRNVGKGVCERISFERMLEKHDDYGDNGSKMMEIGCDLYRKYVGDVEISGFLEELMGESCDESVSEGLDA